MRRLQLSAAVTVAGLFALCITGIIPDASFDSGARFSGRFVNDYGTFINHVSDANLGNLTGPFLFDMMEHVSLIVPGLALMILVLIVHCRDPTGDRAGGATHTASLVLALFVPARGTSDRVASCVVFVTAGQWIVDRRPLESVFPAPTR